MTRLIWTVVLGFAAACGQVVQPGDMSPDPGDDKPVLDNMLAAVAPPIAATGDTVVLEGTFRRQGGGSPEVIAQFSGVNQRVAAAAHVLSEHRATVVVPTAAIDGPLTVEIDGVATAPVAFHHPRYTLGVGVFGNVAQPAAARPSSGPITPRSGHTSAVIGNYLYVVGGISKGTPLASVERAPINADGTLGAFSIVGGATLVTARHLHTSAVIGGYLYVIGGSDTVSPLGSIERAPIDAEGTLAAFQSLDDATLATARQSHTSEVIGNRIYVIGGKGAAGNLGSVEQAEVHPDGALDKFTEVPARALATVRSAHSSAVIGKSLYVVGGFDGTDLLGTVERAPINDDGTLGAFAAMSGAVLVTRRSNHSIVVLGANLYVIGGTGPMTALDTVEQAAFDGNGTMGKFTQLASAALSSISSGHTSAVVGNYLYVVGGLGITGTNDLQRASINADGSLPAFANIPVVVNSARAFHTANVVGRTLYVAGGTNGSDRSVERATIGPDGQLGAFTNAGMAVSARVAYGSAVIGNYLYLIGGTGGVSVERAAINPDTSLSAFATLQGVSLLTQRGYFCTAMAGKFLYVVGGFAGSASMASVERAAIGPDGTLGKFETVTPVLTTARHGAVCVVIGKYLHIIGGWNVVAGGAQTPLATVERATIQADGTLGAFMVTPGVTATVPRTYASAAVIGDYLYMLGGENAATIERAKIGATGVLSTFTAYSNSTLSLVRWQAAAVVVDHSVYMIAGSAGIPLNSIDRAVFPAVSASP